MAALRSKVLGLNYYLTTPTTSDLAISIYHKRHPAGAFRGAKLQLRNPLPDQQTLYADWCATVESLLGARPFEPLSLAPPSWPGDFLGNPFYSEVPRGEIYGVFLDATTAYHELSTVLFDVVLDSLSLSGPLYATDVAHLVKFHAGPYRNGRQLIAFVHDINGATTQLAQIAIVQALATSTLPGSANAAAIKAHLSRMLGLWSSLPASSSGGFMHFWQQLVASLPSHPATGTAAQVRSDLVHKVVADDPVL